MDGAGAAARFHKVANLEGLGGKKLHPTCHVGQKILQRQGECQTSYRQHRHQRGDLDAQAAQGQDDGHEQHDPLLSDPDEPFQLGGQAGAAKCPVQQR